MTTIPNTRMKYAPHYEVARKGWFGIEYLTSKGGWYCAFGMLSAKPKTFRSSKSALAAAVKHDASMIAYWLEEGQRTYNRLTVYGDKLLPNIESQDGLD